MVTSSAVDGKPRRRPTLALVAATLAGQAVIALGVVVALTVMNAPGSPRPAPPARAVSTPTGSTAPTVTPPSPSETVPPYYAALAAAPPRGLRRARDITIRDTGSGKALATVQPPVPYPTFSMVAATSSANSYIVAASRQSAPYDQALQTASGVLGVGQTQLYLLAFNPATRATRISPLPVPAMPGLNIWGAALSPDNSRLAVEFQRSESVAQIRVYALAKGAADGGFQSSGPLLGTWTAAGSAAGYVPLDPQALSWSADDRTLAFDWQGPGTPIGGLRLLDAAGTGGSLIADSRLAIRVPNWGQAFYCLASVALTADGKTALCAGARPGPAPTSAATPPPGSHDVPGPAPIGEIGQFSVATGKLVRQFAPPRDPLGNGPVGVDLLWTSRTGSVTVVGQTGIQLLRSPTLWVMGPGYTRVIPRAPGTGQLAW